MPQKISTDDLLDLYALKILEICKYLPSASKQICIFAIHTPGLNQPPIEVEKSPTTGKLKFKLYSAPISAKAREFQSDDWLTNIHLVVTIDVLNILRQHTTESWDYTDKRFMVKEPIPKIILEGDPSLRQMIENFRKIICNQTPKGDWTPLDLKRTMDLILFGFSVHHLLLNCQGVVSDYRFLAQVVLSRLKVELADRNVLVLV